MPQHTLANRGSAVTAAAKKRQEHDRRALYRDFVRPARSRNTCFITARAKAAWNKIMNEFCRRAAQGKRRAEANVAGVSECSHAALRRLLELDGFKYHVQPKPKGTGAFSWPVTITITWGKKPR